MVSLTVIKSHRRLIYYINTPFIARLTYDLYSFRYFLFLERFSSSCKGLEDFFDIIDLLLIATFYFFKFLFNFSEKFLHIFFLFILY
jgi:hypothetical protein